jgi:hypothetical protein
MSKKSNSTGAQVKPETPVVASARRNVKLFKRATGGLGAAVGLVAATGLFFANPSTVGLPKFSNPHELIRDASFNQANIWVPIGDTKVNAFDRQRESGPHPFFGRINGTVRQEIPLRPENKRAYRFSLLARAQAKSPAVRATLRAQTACAADEERAETAVTATESWQLFSVTLVPQHGDACSLRLEIVGPSTGVGSLDVASASFVDAGLVNPSFEGGDGWQISDAKAGGTFRSVPLPGAPDGGAVGELVVASLPTSVGQDVVLDLSAEPVIGSFSLLARSSKGAADVELRLREPCSDRTAKAKFKLSGAWQLISVQQARLSTPKGELPVESPVLIRPGGPPCTMRVELGVGTANATVQFDAAYLDLQSYNSPAGSARYRATVQGVADEADQNAKDAAAQAQIDAGRSLSRQDPTRSQP